jgi:hypothetical protein
VACIAVDLMRRGADVCLVGLWCAGGVACELLGLPLGLSCRLLGLLLLHGMGREHGAACVRGQSRQVQAEVRDRNRDRGLLLQHALA